MKLGWYLYLCTQNAVSKTLCLGNATSKTRCSNTGASKVRFKIFQHIYYPINLELLDKAEHLLERENNLKIMEPIFPFFPCIIHRFFFPILVNVSLPLGSPFLLYKIFIYSVKDFFYGNTIHNTILYIYSITKNNITLYKYSNTINDTKDTT